MRTLTKEEMREVSGGSGFCDFSSVNVLETIGSATTVGLFMGGPFGAFEGAFGATAYLSAKYGVCSLKNMYYS